MKKTEDPEVPRTPSQMRRDRLRRGVMFLYDLQRLRIACSYDMAGVDLGASIACSGACLTVVAFDDHSFSVNVVAETVRRTNLSGLKPGDPVNVECDVLAKHVERLLDDQDPMVARTAARAPGLMTPTTGTPWLAAMSPMVRAASGSSASSPEA